MVNADELRRILAEDFGINSDAGLVAALKKMPGIDISAMVRKPVAGCADREKAS